MGKTTLGRSRWFLLSLASILVLGACADDDDGGTPDGGTGSGGRAPSTGGRNSGGTPGSSGGSNSGGVPGSSGGSNSGGQSTGGTAPSSGGAGGSVVEDPDASLGGKDAGGDGASSGGDADAGGDGASSGDGGMLVPLTVTVGHCAIYPSTFGYALLWFYDPGAGVERFDSCDSNTTCVFHLAPGTVVRMDCWSPGQTFEARSQIAPPTSAECHFEACFDPCTGAPSNVCSIAALLVPTAISVDWERNECWPDTCP